MSRPIFTAEFWKNRIQEATFLGRPWEALFRCSRARWDAVQVRQREILRKHVLDTDSVLDVGCAWGRLLTVLPQSWRGDYLGIDQSPDFIDIARNKHPGKEFWLHDMRLPIPTKKRFDWGIAVAVRGSVLMDASQEVWDRMEFHIREVARQLLILEYDENEEGVVS